LHEAKRAINKQKEIFKKKDITYCYHEHSRCSTLALTRAFRWSRHCWTVRAWWHGLRRPFSKHSWLLCICIGNARLSVQQTRENVHLHLLIFQAINCFCLKPWSFFYWKL